MHWQSAAEVERPDHDDGDDVEAIGAADCRDTIPSLRRRIDELRAELEGLEPVIGAAVLAAAAFRLRDEEGLTLALRNLVRSLRRLEDAPPDA